jgi:hypothetical protein
VRDYIVLTFVGCSLGLLFVGLVRYETATALAWDDPRVWSAAADLIEVAVLLLLVCGLMMFGMAALSDRRSGPPKDETVVRVTNPKGHQVAAKVVIHPPAKPKASDSSEFELTLDP